MAVWVPLHGEQSLTALKRCGLLEYNKFSIWIDLIL